jgi:hypothetical protein
MIVPVRLECKLQCGELFNTVSIGRVYVLFFCPGCVCPAFAALPYRLVTRVVTHSDLRLAAKWA